LLPSPLRADLLEYVKKPEPAFVWKLKDKTTHPLGTIYDLHLVSQVWQGITWEHQVQIYQARNASPTSTVYLWNQGGKANIQSTTLGMLLASKIQAPVVFLYGIPNQPLFDGKKEDALIAETFVRYLSTKDENWPLLFPMVKSLVKCMDALQEFSQQEWHKPAKDFVVSGASKRGWTTWLTAVVDPRVKAISPVVIDTLNFQEQLPHQLESFGAYSEQIKDYTERGLVPMPRIPEAKRLWSMVDPYVYRDKLTMPKLIINGNNDPYWSTDALNLYWDDLKGDKWLLYVPNAGHNLQQKFDDRPPDLTRAINGLAAFARHQILGKPLPRLQWKHADGNGKLQLTVESTPPPRRGRLWVAQAPMRDFRKSRWTEQPALASDGTVHGEIAPPTEGYVAFYAELDYEIDGLLYHLSTQLRLAGKTRAGSEANTTSRQSP
jgi:PhoPQ-activated pathogenicity-related protein